MSLLSSGKTDIGKVRSTNQDSIYLNNELKLFIIADGMGGHNGGDIASKIAVETIPEYFNNHPNLDDKEKLTNSILEANKKIFSYSKEKKELKGMGTTVVSLLFTAEKLLIGNIGDSRLYLVNENQLFQITSDHTLVQEKINMGIYSRDQGARDKQKNVLIRTLGYEENVKVDQFSYKVQKGDLFLMCSDGLHAKVSDERILDILNSCIPDPSSVSSDTLTQTVDNLILEANNNGGNDNISVLLIVTQ